jgi:hypothetical protein
VLEIQAAPAENAKNKRSFNQQINATLLKVQVSFDLLKCLKSSEPIDPYKVIQESM